MAAPLSTFMTQLLDDSINRNSFGETSSGDNLYSPGISTDSADSTVMTDNLDHSGSSNNNSTTRKEQPQQPQPQQQPQQPEPQPQPQPKTKPVSHNMALKKARKNFANTTSNTPLQQPTQPSQPVVRSSSQKSCISNDDNSLSMASACRQGSSANINLLQTSSTSLTNFMTQLLNDSEIDKLIAQGESAHGDYSTSQTTSNTSANTDLPQLMSITSDNATQQRPSLILSKGAANVLASAVKSIQKQSSDRSNMMKSSDTGMDADVESTAISSVHDPYSLLKSVYRGGNPSNALAHSLNFRRGGLSRSNSDGSISVLSKTDLQKSSSQSLSIAGLRQQLQKSASVTNLRNQMKRLQSCEDIYKGSMELDHNDKYNESGEYDVDLGESTDLDASGLSNASGKKKKRHSRSTTRHRSKSTSGGKRRAKSGSKKRAPSMENSGETTTSSKRKSKSSRGRTPNGASKTKRKSSISKKEKSSSLLRSSSVTPRSRSTSQAPRSRSTSQGKARRSQSQDKAMMTPRSRSQSKAPRSRSQSQSHSKTPRKRRSSDPRVSTVKDGSMRDVSLKDKRERRSSDSMRDVSAKDVAMKDISMKRDKSKSRSSTRKSCLEESGDVSMKDVSMKRDKSKSRSSTRKSCMEESSRREGGSGRQRTSSADGGSGRRQRTSSAEGGSGRRQRTSSADGGSGRRQRTSAKTGGDCPATPRVGSSKSPGPGTQRVSSKSPGAGARTSRKASAVQDPSYCMTPKTPTAKHKRTSSGVVSSKSPGPPKTRGEHASSSKRGTSKEAPRTPRTPRTPKTPKTPSSARRSSGKKSASRSKSFDIGTNPETAEVVAAAAKSPLRRTKTTAMENMITAAPALQPVRQRRASHQDMDTSFQKMMEAAAKINAITRSMDASSKSHTTQTRRRNSMTPKDSEARNNNSYNSSADFASPKPSRAPLRRNQTVDASTPATPRALTRRRNSLSMTASQTNTPRRSNKQGEEARIARRTGVNANKPPRRQSTEAAPTVQQAAAAVAAEAAQAAMEMERQRARSKSAGASRRNRNQISKQQAQQVLRQAVVEEIKAKEEAAKQPPLPAPPANPLDTSVSTEPAAEGTKKEATWISRRKKSLFLSQQSQARISAGV